MILDFKQIKNYRSKVELKNNSNEEKEDKKFGSSSSSISSNQSFFNHQQINNINNNNPITKTNQARRDSYDVIAPGGPKYGT